MLDDQLRNWIRTGYSNIEKYLNSNEEDAKIFFNQTIPTMINFIMFFG